MFEYLQTIAYVAIIFSPMLFPKFLFRKKESNDKLIFFNLVRESDNPFMNEPTAISLYDQDEQKYFEVSDIYDNESYEEICAIINKMIEGYDNVYFVTYNIENKETCFKAIMEVYLEEIEKKLHFMDLKKVFYCIHQKVAKIQYSDMLEFYKVPRLNCKPIEYCALFDQLLKDFGAGAKEKRGIHVLYDLIHPLHGC